MLETSARLLRLLVLLYARGFWSGTELAERLDVSERTLRRDIERLRTLGYGVRSDVGVGGGYQLEAGAALPPLAFEDDEALVVALALRTVAAGALAGVESAALRALTKLEQVLPSRLRHRIEPLLGAVASLQSGEAPARLELLSALAAAQHNCQCASFRYRDSAGRSSVRSAEPHGLVHAGDRWYLVAWDADRADWRTFRVDRIEGELSTSARFSRRRIPDGDAATYVSRSIASKAYSYRARVTFHAPFARVRARVHPLAGYLRPLGEERCQLESGANSLSVLAMHIALVEEPFEIEEPPELVEHVRDLATRLQHAADLSS